MITLTLPALKAGSESCFHNYVESIQGYMLECVHCDKEITVKQWGHS
jgi:hypothetical protein